MSKPDNPRNKGSTGAGNSISVTLAQIEKALLRKGKQKTEAQPNKAEQTEAEQKQDKTDYSELGEQVIKVSLGAGTVVAIIWLSKYVFLAIAGSIKGFKEMRRSIRAK